MKKIAVIADIHSNIYALREVLADIEKREVDQIVNLGDTFYGPIAPAEVYNVLKDKNYITILGNQDRILFKNDYDKNSTFSFVLQEIGNDGLNWLKDLSFSESIEEKILLCHASPKSDTHYLLEDVSCGYPVLKKESDIQTELLEIQENVILCGHTHIPRTVQLLKGILILNPGSVGLQAYEEDQPGYHKMETGSPHARYAILSEQEGYFETEHIQLNYDWQAAAKKAEMNGREDWKYSLLYGRIRDLNKELQ